MADASKAPPAQESVISTPSTQEGAAKAGMSEEQFISLLQKGIDEGVDAALKRFETRTNPSTRPSMAGASSKDVPDLGDTKAWQITQDDSKAFNKAKAFLPAGTTYRMGADQKAAIFEDVDRRFYKGVDMNSFPKGDIEENFSILRLAKAQTFARNGDPYAWERIAPWETAYYDAVRKAQAESNGADGGFLAPETLNHRVAA